MPVLASRPLLLLLVGLSALPSLAIAQTSNNKTSERGLPEATGEPSAKSERALPTQAKPADTPPAEVERAMPAAKTK